MNNLSLDLTMARAGFTLEAALTAEAGRITALFGPSGAGKSSILAAIVGLEKPATGWIRLGGQPLFDRAARLNVPAHRRRIGMVFQSAALFPHMSVASNLAYGRRRSPEPVSNDAFARLIDLLGIKALLERRPGTLSGGERQRVAIGRALAANPRALLLDEPMTGLDQPRREELLAHLEELREAWRIPILLVSHRLEEVTRLADHMVLIEAGRIRAAGPPPQVLAGTGNGLDAGVMGGALNVEAGEIEDGLQVLSGGFGRLLVRAAAARPQGSRARIRIAARDVMLATARPEAISANNVLTATVQAITPVNEAECDVALSLADGTPLAARITRHSAGALGLQTGQPVFAIIKTVQLV
jgi:molybdate transport system ATP-binding protein